MVVQSQFIEQFSGENIPRYELSSLCSEFLDGDWIESKDQSDAGYRLVQTGNVGVGEYIDKSGRARFVSEETFKRLNCTEIFSGDILFSRLPEPLGRCCIIPEAFPKAITAVDCTIARLNEKCLPEFLVVYTATSMYSSQVDKCVTGTTRQRISRNNLAKISVPCPSRDEQIAFVKIVRQADKSKFDGLKSQFIEETKLWENEGSIRDLIHNTVEKAGKKYSADSKIRYVDISSVDNETNTVTGVTEYIFKDAPSRAQQCVKKGDILVSTVRPNLKNIAVNHLDGEDLVASSGFCVLRPKEGCAGLIMAYILSDVFTEKMTLVAKGTNYPAIHDSDILDYKIRLPEDSKMSMIDRLFRQADKSKYLS